MAINTGIICFFIDFYNKILPELVEPLLSGHASQSLELYFPNPSGHTL